MSPQTKTSLRITAAIGLLFLAASGQFASAQTTVLPNDVRQQLSQPATSNPAQSKPPQGASQAQTKTPAAATVKTQPGKPGAAATAAQSKTGARAQVKAASTELGPPATSKAVATPAAQKNPVAAAAVAPKAAAPPELERVGVPRRDPFDPLVGKNNTNVAAGPQAPLPAGKPGLMVASLRIDGIVKQSNSMIAIVSNPQMRVYFLREGDRLYDGDVEHITMEGVSFHETGKDAFGKPVERELTKRLYPTPGEQQ